MSITLWQYYTNLAAGMTRNAFADIATAAQWQAVRQGLHRQFMRSLGLDPLPPRCDLKLTECGTTSGPGFRVRRIAFQILPDCWASAGIWYPDPLPPGKCPGVLYVCGHGASGMMHYQAHHARWVRRGYVCLVLDTIEQHDNPGEHHGLWTGERPDWLALGYTAAGGEAWNGIRALDVLAALPEVDPERLGVTGVSGGGAQSFYVAVADERIRTLASSCGISPPQDALLNRHLPNHCDCMYYHNLYGRDTSEYAALLAPRAALFYFSEHDSLFSPAESEAFVERTRHVYRLLGCEDRCTSVICPGPHGERPEGLAAIDRWFDLHLTGQQRPALPQPEATLAEPELTVFNGAPPTGNRLDLLPELLSPRGRLELPRTPAEWPALKQQAIDCLRREVFGWLDGLKEQLALTRVADSRSGGQGTEYRKYRGDVAGMQTWLETQNPGKPGSTAIISVAGPDQDASDLWRPLWTHAPADAAQAVFEPRGCGLSSAAAERCELLLRAGALVGLTPVMLMVQDLRLLLDRTAEIPELHGRRLVLHGKGEAAVACLYAALLDARVAGVVLEDMPASHRQGAPILGILRQLDLSQAIGLMAPRPVAIIGQAHGGGYWTNQLYARLNCADRLIATGDRSQAFARVVAACSS